MPTRSRRFYAWLLLTVVVVGACDDGPPWGSDASDQTGLDRDDFGPTAAYDRRLIFLGPGAELPTAAVFDFAALSDSTHLHRGVRARLVDGVDWVSLMDAGWEMEPMREPWRLVPHGPLKVVVGDAGELDALLLRGDVDVRLETGPAIDEYSPDAGTQLVIRQGRLRLGAEPVPGILLDAQLARAVNPASVRRPPVAPEDTSALEAENDIPADTLAAEPDPSPAPQEGAEGLVVDNSGFYVVFAASAAGDFAWVSYGERDDVRRGTRLEPTEWEPYEEAAAQAPVAWRVVTPGGGLAGELRAEAADRSVLNPEVGPGMLGYAIVTGYIEDRGVRRNVYGLVRHVR